jgi:hypothetical protein
MMTEQEHMGSVEHFSRVGSMVTNIARCTGEITYSILITKAAINRKKLLTI